jgi:zinc protease
MSSQRRKLHSISALWLLSAAIVICSLLPGLARGQDEERAAPKPRPRVPAYEPGNPVQKKVLKNGLTILVQEQRTSERVAGAVALRMGTLYEPDEDAGRGQVLINSITVGTEQHSPAEFALRVLAADAKVEAGVGPDLGQITISTKRERVDNAIDLLTEIVLHPSFPDTAVDAARVRALNLAAKENENPIKGAYSLYLSTMYRGSPFARPVTGTVQGIADCRRKDVVALHKKYFVGGNMVVSFVGNFDGKKVMSRLEKAFAAAPSGGPPKPVAGEPIPLAADTTTVAERDYLASCLVYGYPAPGYSDPDYAAFTIIEAYLAASDRSPISYWMSQSGLATAVGVIYPPYPKRSSMAVYLATAPARLAAARDTVAAVMGRLKTTPLDEGEWNEQLKRVQNGTFQNQSDPLVRARSMSQYEVAGLGYDFLRKYELSLLQLNAESVRAAAARWFTHTSQVTTTPLKSESKL